MNSYRDPRQVEQSAVSPGAWNDCNGESGAEAPQRVYARMELLSEETRRRGRCAEIMQLFTVSLAIRLKPSMGGSMARQSLLVWFYTKLRI